MNAVVLIVICYNVHLPSLALVIWELMSSFWLCCSCSNSNECCSLDCSIFCLWSCLLFSISCPINRDHNSTILTQACVDPEVGGQRVRTPLKNHKNIGFLSNTSRDPLINHKTTVNNLSVTLGRFFLGWTSTKQELMCLARENSIDLFSKYWVET